MELAGSRASLAMVDDSFRSVMILILRDVTREYILKGGFTSPTNLHINCVVGKFISNFVNDTVQDSINNALHDLISSLTLVDSIVQFYKEQLVPEVTAIPAPQDCIGRFISLSCAACSKIIPDICHSVCGQLALGCFSPYRRGLIGQLDILWNITAQVIETIESQTIEVLQLVQEPVDLLSLDFEDTNAVRAFVS